MPGGASSSRFRESIARSVALQDVLAPLRLAQDERRVVPLDLQAQRLLCVVDEGGIEERAQRGHAEEDQCGDRARAQGLQAFAVRACLHRGPEGEREEQEDGKDGARPPVPPASSARPR